MLLHDLRRILVWVLFIPICAHAGASLSIIATNGQGSNTGIEVPPEGLSLQVSIQGTTQTAVKWSISGAGTLSSTSTNANWGSIKYMPPGLNAFPANLSVTITASLTATPSVAGSYHFSLVYPQPVIRGIYVTGSNQNPNQLISAQTDAIQILSNNLFAQKAQVSVNGTVVPSTWISPSEIDLKLAVPDTAILPYTFTVTNPKPNLNATSGSYSQTMKVAPKTLQINYFVGNNMTFTDGLNQTPLPLGGLAQFYAQLTSGSGSNAVTYKVTGGGSISSAGLYQAPTSLPSSGTAVTITATLNSNPAITASRSFTLKNLVPEITSMNPVQLKAGASNQATLSGRGFVSGTIIQMNGVAVPTQYQSYSKVIAILAPSASATSVNLTAVNPAPGISSSGVFAALVGAAKTAEAKIGLAAGLAIPQDFLGLSHEWGDQEQIGSTLTLTNSVYRQLIKNLMLDSPYPFLIRMGGGSTDSSGMPVSRTVAPLIDLAKNYGVHFTLGVNMGSNNPTLAAEQAQFFYNNLPDDSIEAFELGNEPDNYHVSFRPPAYSFTDYVNDFTTWQNAIYSMIPSTVKLMGPSMGWVGNLATWFAPFEAREKNYVTPYSQHFYPGIKGPNVTFSPGYLLNPTTSTTGPEWIAAYVNTAHKYGQKFRVGEMNSIDEGGIAGISDAFESALWVIDQLFEFAKIGVDGVNIHGVSPTSTTRCDYCPWVFRQGNAGNTGIFEAARVNPIYYGELLFQMATVNHAKLLPVSVNAGSSNIKVWAVIDAKQTVRLLVLSKDPAFAGNVEITLPGYQSATAIRLTAPSYHATQGVLIGGRTFDGTLDGSLVGIPVQETYAELNGVYRIPMSPTSAALLTLYPQQ